MSMKITVTGGAETARALRELGKRSSTEAVLRQALRPGAREIVLAARAAAPRDTGALARSIAVGVIRTKQHAARLVVGHRRDDPQNRWRISHIVEFGSRFVSARPYVRKAAQLLPGTVQSFGKAIWPLIVKEATRVASRRAVRRR
jgi:HK97 gp10 family phage protein